MQMDGVEVCRVFAMLFPVSIRGRLDIESVDGTDDGTSESIRNFGVIANPAVLSPTHPVCCIARHFCKDCPCTMLWNTVSLL